MTREYRFAVIQCIDGETLDEYKKRTPALGTDRTWADSGPHYVVDLQGRILAVGWLLADWPDTKEGV